MVQRGGAKKIPGGAAASAPYIPRLWVKILWNQSLRVFKLGQGVELIILKNS